MAGSPSKNRDDVSRGEMKRGKSGIEHVSGTTREELTGNWRDPPFCYCSFLLLCILQFPPMMPSWSWCFRSKRVKTQASPLSGSKVCVEFWLRSWSHVDGGKVPLWTSVCGNEQLHVMYRKNNKFESNFSWFNGISLIARAQNWMIPWLSWLLDDHCMSYHIFH